MQIQRMLPEDAKNAISFVREFHTLPPFSFESATYPYKPFIRLSILCIKNHKINLHCP